MKKLLCAGIAAVALSSGAAQAALLSIAGGTAYTTPGINNFSVGWTGVVNTTSAVTVSTTEANVTLTYEFIYREAGFSNTFNAGGFSFQGDQCGTSFGSCVAGLTFDVVQAAAGAPGFSFVTPANPGDPLANGETAITFGNPAQNYSFFATFNAPGVGTPTPTTGDVLWLSFDDSGANTDDNHDDMIIRVTARVQDIPEPASLALLGAGLLGLGAAVRRRKAA